RNADAGLPAALPAGLDGAARRAAVARDRASIVAAFAAQDEPVAADGRADARRAGALPPRLDLAGCVAAVAGRGVAVVADFAHRAEQAVAAVARVALAVEVDVGLRGIRDQRAVVDAAREAILVGVLVLHPEARREDEQARRLARVLALVVLTAILVDGE